MSEREHVVRDNGLARVEVGLRPDETVADVEGDFGISFDHTHEMFERGTESWHSSYRWIGPVKVMAYKEVGPPPWRWPKVGIQPSLSHGAFVRFIVGWRSTAYALCFLWAGRRA